MSEKKKMPPCMNIYIPDQNLKNTVKEMADALGMSVSAVISECLAKWVVEAKHKIAKRKMEAFSDAIDEMSEDEVMALLKEKGFEVKKK